MYTLKMTVSVMPDRKMTMTSRSYRGDTAEKRCKSDAKKFTKESGRTTHIYRVKRGTEERPWFYYYFAVPSDGFQYSGEFIEAIHPA